jgi:lipopolysaccharide/colanic/teichoic acid biosynthesis glycosyltransferase
VKKLIEKKSGIEVYNNLSKFANLESDDALVVSTTNLFNILNNKQYSCIVNLSKINNVRYINKFFEGVNSTLKNGDIFVFCFETFSARRRRKPINKIPIIGVFYFLFEFVFLRVFPKVWGFKKIYFTITRGRNRILSKAEGLGRVISCGFDIQEYFYSNGLLYVITKKVKEPTYDLSPSYGPLYRMPRVGKNGEMIKVYKFRTMHPYSEYLQEYVVNMYGYSEMGKPANDFRVTPWGKFFRKYWLDELPQLLNVLIGDMKIVGVRPVSRAYFDKLPSDIKQLRLKQKPGCIPPYVSLNRNSNVDSVLQSEREYLEHAAENSLKTDLLFFFKAIYNIIVRRKRSA